MHDRGTADFGEFHCLLLLRLQAATDLERRFIVWVKENVAVKHGTVGPLELSADQCM